MTKEDKNTTYNDTITTLFKALDSKDVYTAGHSTRVGDMAYKLGVALGVKEEELELIHIGGHLHDVGKLKIPDCILNKIEKLNPEEWELMKKHCEFGYNIVNKEDGLKSISNVILHHHERWDGKGYPDGLKENEIPFVSRILAVCDSVDAMKSNRPYRNLLSDQVCRDEIIKNKGIMYDSKIADCIINNWDEIVTSLY